MPRIAVLPPLDINATPDSEPITIDIETYDLDRIVDAHVEPIRAARDAARVAESVEDYARRYLLPRNVERFDLADYQRAFVEAIDRVRITPPSTPFMEVIARSRPTPSPTRRYRRPVWAITPERIALGYMAQSRISPWGGGDSAFYSQDLPDHGDRVFPVARRRGDMFLPLEWPVSPIGGKA